MVIVLSNSYYSQEKNNVCSFVLSSEKPMTDIESFALEMEKAPREKEVWEDPAVLAHTNHRI